MVWISTVSSGKGWCASGHGCLMTDKLPPLQAWQYVWALHVYRLASNYHRFWQKNKLATKTVAHEPTGDVHEAFAVYYIQTWKNLFTNHEWVLRLEDTQDKMALAYKDSKWTHTHTETNRRSTVDHAHQLIQNMPVHHIRRFIKCHFSPAIHLLC